METKMMHQFSKFLRLIKISRNSSIEVQLLHYLSILIQNLESENSIYYCFSNGYINNIILYPFKFDTGDLASYFASFLRTVSGKLNRETIYLLVNVEEDMVVSFPLYSEALKFARNEEKMIQIAIRAVTLNVYNACDDMVLAFLTTPPASEYFSDLVLHLRDQCLHFDSLVRTTMDSCTREIRNQLQMGTDLVVNDLYYFNDILKIGQPGLSRLMIENIFRSLVLPALLPLQSSENFGSQSSITSLCVICRLLQVVDGRELVNSVAIALLCSYMFSFARSTIEKGDSDEGAMINVDTVNHFAEYLIDIKEVIVPFLEAEGAENISKTNLFGILSEYISCRTGTASCLLDKFSVERNDVLSLILSENISILLAFLMFLIILSEHKDLDSSLSSILGFADKNTGQEMSSNNLLQRAMDGNIFATHMPKILTALLRVLVSQPPFSISTRWHIGWVLGKLLRYHDTKFTEHDIDLFNVSYEQSREGLAQELNGCWSDYIPTTVEIEWLKCTRALAESSGLKDPFLTLEVSTHDHLPEGSMSSSHAWQRMVDAVKVFVLWHQLEAIIFKRDTQEEHMNQLRSALKGTLDKEDGIDIHSATYGTRTGLGPGIPCKIAFSKREVKDVYLIPVAKGIFGKLLLAEKLSLDSDEGVVIAVAPLAGLSPKIDDEHSTWLHLRIREFDPRVHAKKAGANDFTGANNVVDGRWTLAFQTTEICDSALLLTRRELDKQRSSVERLLAPFLQNYSPKNSSD
ncbi:protein TRANSPARENT TESTA 9-like isoform X2 [Papaver somniferum]|uniref:protein TRANSPARENT TESTA 9-like isoform X2 n=1 Tax=Papaver somniferum TaxID=3469 RepID=UPI000E6F7DE1|nr:protein TRANSPARENT TESTA 9-like isoform X2 [Papaver somniferum]